MQSLEAMFEVLKVEQDRHLAEVHKLLETLPDTQDGHNMAWRLRCAVATGLLSHLYYETEIEYRLAYLNGVRIILAVMEMDINSKNLGDALDALGD
jgi:hypothetical protein